MQSVTEKFEIPVKSDGEELTFREACRRAPEIFRQYLETHTKEEIAEKLTTYEPGVPHYWFGRPVAPLTKEELLAHWNGGPEPEIHYLDGNQPMPSEAATAGLPLRREP